jgi:hypothetical protein
MKTYQSVIHVSVGVYMGGGCKCEISQVWGEALDLELGWLGNIYRQRTTPTYNYV